MKNLPGWNCVGHPPRMLTGEAHLWLAHLERPDLVPAAREILSPIEIERGLRYRSNRDRTWFFARHFLLRTLLSLYLHQSASSLDIQRTQHGKPFLAGHPIYFNLSDSGEWCLFAFTQLAPIGVDLENVREQTDLMQVARRYFSNVEMAALERLPHEQQVEAFYHIWTQKEALIKAIGEGLSIPLDSFDVGTDPGQPGSLRMDRGASARSWAMRTFIPKQGFKAAVCTETAAAPDFYTFQLEI